MLEALSNGSTKGRMVFDFDSLGPFGVLTTARATQMVAHLPLTIDNLIIQSAKHHLNKLGLWLKYTFEFWNALIERVKQFHNLNELDICHILLVTRREGKRLFCG